MCRVSWGRDLWYDASSKPCSKPKQLIEGCQIFNALPRRPQRLLSHLYGGADIEGTPPGCHRRHADRGRSNLGMRSCATLRSIGRSINLILSVPNARFGSHLNRKALHFSPAQIIEITQCLSPSFKHKSTTWAVTSAAADLNAFVCRQPEIIHKRSKPPQLHVV